MTSISHKIEIKPNNKQKTYFRKAFGCSRLAYNWGLSEWQRRYKAGEKVSTYDLKKSFNAIKKEQFPFVTEVTKYAVQQPFINLGKAFTKFFSDLKKGVVSYPQFKKKRDNSGSSISEVTRLLFPLPILTRKDLKEYHITKGRSAST